MNDHNVFNPIIAFAFCFIVCPVCHAQSGSFHGNSSATVVPTNSDFPRNSLNVRQKQIQRILDTNHERQFAGVTNYAQLVNALRQLGLPVFVDYSAWDDSWSEDEPIRLLSANLPIYEMVQLQLDKVNATLAIMDNKLAIISKDVASDPEYFTRIIYDINFTSADESFVWELRSAIAPDSWDDTNGDGVVMLRKSAGRQLLIVSQSYSVHRDVQEYLRAMARMESNLGGESFSPAIANRGVGSTVVQLPAEDNSPDMSAAGKQQRLRLPRRRQRSGGVFRVPTQTD